MDVPDQSSRPTDEELFAELRSQFKELEDRGCKVGLSVLTERGQAIETIDAEMLFFADAKDLEPFPYAGVREEVELPLPCLQLLGSHSPNEWDHCAPLPDESIASLCARWLREKHNLVKGVVRVRWRDAIEREHTHDLTLGIPRIHPGYTRTEMRKVAAEILEDATKLFLIRPEKRHTDGHTVFAALVESMGTWVKALEEERTGRRGFPGELSPSDVLGEIIRVEHSRAASHAVALLLREVWSFEPYPVEVADWPASEALLRDQELWDQKHDALSTRIEETLKLLEFE
jgi:hypothetical protein